MSNSTFNSIKISGIVSAVPKNKKVLMGENTIRKSIEYQTSSDLGYIAAKYLLDKKQISLDEVGILLFVSKTPDYRGPATATVLHGRLKLSIDCIAFDVNLGSTGFAVGTQIVCSNLDSINKKYGLLIVGDTASKQISEKDNFSLFFGDGVSAILFERTDDLNSIININTSSYSSKYNAYIIEKGGFRINKETSKSGQNKKSIENNFLNINRDQYLEFINNEVSLAIQSFLVKQNLKLKNFDIIIYHMFDQKTKIKALKEIEKSSNYLSVDFKKFGNTCGNSLPLLLSNTYGEIENKSLHILICTYGEGLSVGIVDLVLNTNEIFGLLESDDYYKNGYISHNS